MTNRKTELTFRELERLDDGGIFVLNNTKGAERGNVMFTVARLSGLGNDTVTVPATFIPIDLLDQVARRQLMDSSEFRRCISQRRLVLITEQYAQQLLSDPDAEVEKERLYNESQATMNMVQAVEDMVTGDMLEPGLAKVNTRDNPMREMASQDEANVNPRIESLVEALKESEDEVGTLNSIRNMGSLTSEDARYILANVANKFVRLREFASRALKPAK